MAYPTNPIYKFTKDLDGNINHVKKVRASDSATLHIPFDEANTDYQEYLAWVAEGNTPEAAD